MLAGYFKCLLLLAKDFLKFPFLVFTQVGLQKM